MGRIIAAAVLGTFCLAAGAAGEYELFTYDALGVALTVPPGYEVDAAPPAESATAATVHLSWPEGPYAGLDALIIRRKAAYANVVIWAGLYQRRLGAAYSFEAEADPLSGAELAAAGADDGLRGSYVVGEEERRRRLDVLFLASAKTFYLVEVSYPDVVESRLAAATQKMLNTFKILPPVEDTPSEARGDDPGWEPPSE